MRPRSVPSHEPTRQMKLPNKPNREQPTRNQWVTADLQYGSSTGPAKPYRLLLARENLCLVESPDRRQQGNDHRSSGTTQQRNDQTNPILHNRYRSNILHGNVSLAAGNAGLGRPFGPALRPSLTRKTEPHPKGAVEASPNHGGFHPRENLATLMSSHPPPAKTIGPPFRGLLGALPHSGDRVPRRLGWDRNRSCNGRSPAPERLPPLPRNRCHTSFRFLIRKPSTRSPYPDHLTLPRHVTLGP